MVFVCGADSTHVEIGMMDRREHVIAPGDAFERHVTISGPCALEYSFSVDDSRELEFSVLHKRTEAKNLTRLLPASTYSQLSGEVLLPGPGTCIARWHNPSGWFWSAAATLHYGLAQKRPSVSSELVSHAVALPPTTATDHDADDDSPNQAAAEPSSESGLPDNCQADLTPPPETAAAEVCYMCMQ